MLNSIPSFAQFSSARSLSESSLPDPTEGLDMEFIARAEVIRSFNLRAADFQSKKHKKEIRFLIKKHFFPKLTENVFMDGDIEREGFNAAIAKLKTVNLPGFVNLVEYKVDGVGPGEILMYFIYDEVYLGGGASAGADIVITDGNVYELKGCKVDATGMVKDFKLGGTLGLENFIAELKVLGKKIGIVFNEINGSQMEEIKQSFGKQYADIEDRFRTVAFENYFSLHETIFIDNSPTLSRKGKIILVGKIRREQIFMERVTSGTLKPKIQLL